MKIIFQENTGSINKFPFKNDIIEYETEPPLNLQVIKCLG